MKTAQFVAAAVTAALLGTAGVSIAGATSGSSAPTTAAAPAATAPKPRARRFVRQAVQLTAKAIGVTPQELVQQLRSGKSIADVATAHNVDPQTVVAALVDAATKKIDAARTAGKLTDAQAAKLEANLTTRIGKLVNRNGAPHVRRHARRAGLNVAAQAIGISRAELVQQLRSGKSIADVATAHNVDLQTVEHALVTAADSRLAQRIDKLVHRHFTGTK